MTAERLLLTLSLVAGGLILTAIAVTAGRAPAVPAFAMPAFAPASPTSIVPEHWVFPAGLLCGWLLRWFYSLPWGAIPRAIVALLAGWRSRVIMLGVSLGCMAVLLLY